MGCPDDVLVALPPAVVEMLKKGQFAKMAMGNSFKVKVLDMDVDIPTVQEHGFMNASPADGLAYPGQHYMLTYFMFLGANKMHAFPGQSPSYEFAMVPESDMRQYARQDANQPWVPVTYTPIPGVFPAIGSVTLTPNNVATLGRSIYGFVEITLPTQLNDFGPYQINVRVQCSTTYTDQTPGPLFDSTLVPFTIYRGTSYEMICIAFVRSTVTGQLTPLVQLSSATVPATYFFSGNATLQQSLRGSHVNDKLIWHPDVDPNPGR
jgi:hypothetical protein